MPIASYIHGLAIVDGMELAPLLISMSTKAIIELQILAGNIIATGHIKTLGLFTITEL
jgi:hypothetical protein